MTASQDLQEINKFVFHEISRATGRAQMQKRKHETPGSQLIVATVFPRRKQSPNMSSKDMSSFMTHLLWCLNISSLAKSSLKRHLAKVSKINAPGFVKTKSYVVKIHMMIFLDRVKVS